MNTPHQVPGRMTTLEELLHCELGLHQLCIEGRTVACHSLEYEHVRRFKSETEAKYWISRKSKAWLKKRDRVA
jgi:hypothetical protein